MQDELFEKRTSWSKSTEVPDADGIKVCSSSIWDENNHTQNQQKQKQNQKNRLEAAIDFKKPSVNVTSYGSEDLSQKKRTDVCTQNKRFIHFILTDEKLQLGISFFAP